MPCITHEGEVLEADLKGRKHRVNLCFAMLSTCPCVCHGAAHTSLTLCMHALQHSYEGL